MASVGIAAGGRLCIIDKVFAPSNVPAQDRYDVKTLATFTYAGNSVPPAKLTVIDITIATQLQTPVTPTTLQTGESRLELRKTVENLTQGTTETATLNQASPGDFLKYRIYYSNTGTGLITDLEVNDTVPAYTGFVNNSNLCDTTPTGMSCIPTINIDELDWGFNGPLVGGASGSVSYQIMVND